MKKFKFIFFLFFSFSALANECHLNLFSKIYRLEINQALNVRDIVKTSNCTPEVGNRLAAFISNSEGVINTNFLQIELKKDFPDIEIAFSTNKVSLLNINLAIKDQLSPSSNLFFTQTKSLNAINTLGLSENEQLQILCDSCQNFGEKNIKINITNALENAARTLWFTSKAMAKIKVVKAKRSISFQQKNLDPNDFYQDEILTATPENTVTTLENIQFFKTNKTIMQDSVVYNHDLQAKNLVTYGTPVSVTLKNSSILLQKMAMPMRSARFGETVEIKGPNNKNIIGKVVDYNKAVIEL